MAAESCLEATVASTAAVILGPRAPGWVREWGHAARLVSTRGIPMTMGGWPPERNRVDLVAMAS